MVKYYMAAFLNIHKKDILSAAYFPRRTMAFIFFLLTDLAIVSPAFAAGLEVDDISQNIVETNAVLPGLITAFAYLLALIFAITGILKLRDHVENPQQVPVRVPVIRFLIGGALLALPIIYEAMAVTINGGVNPNFNPTDTIGNAISSLFGNIATFLPLNNISNVLEKIIDSIENLPGLITAVAYVLALVAGIGGLLKLKEHVENPEQVPLREAVIRFFVGGALFALPMIYEAMFNLVGNPGFFGNITSLLGPLGMLFSSYGTGVNSGSSAVVPMIGLCNPAAGIIGGTIGGALCGLPFHAAALPAFLTAISYVIGLFLGVWAIFKIKAHVINPQQTSLWEGISRFAAGGAFFALPIVIEVLRNTMAPLWATGIAAFKQTSFAGFNEGAGVCDGTGGLDVAMYCLMSDTLVPMHVVINFFTMSAGMILAMIGISRLMKSAQDGPRGPGGLGTVMTFATAGALLSYNALMRIFTVSISAAVPGGGLTSTFAQMRYLDGMTPEEQLHAHTVISAILKFMIIVGLISFVRGIFIIRSVAEGNGQASIMAGVTHMLGGALAVNLGAVINFVQATLGITTYGIAFT
jgi:hypothetical protein